MMRVVVHFFMPSTSTLNSINALQGSERRLPCYVSAALTSVGKKEGLGEFEEMTFFSSLSLCVVVFCLSLACGVIQTSSRALHR